MKSNKNKKNILPVLTVAVLIVAVAVTLFTGKSVENDGTVKITSVATGSDLQIRSNEIGSLASYYNYDAEGITVQVMAVRASDGTVRLALNTCQECNGSPYAYFVQEGDEFICQNCGNHFASVVIGKENGGCNPVPITESIYTKQDEVLIVPASFLEDNAYRFANWKKF